MAALVEDTFGRGFTTDPLAPTALSAGDVTINDDNFDNDGQVVVGEGAGSLVTLNFDGADINALYQGTNAAGEFVFVTVPGSAPAVVDPTGGGLPSTDFVVTATPTLFLCFGVGTRISTPVGEVAVEDLRSGDVVLSAAGDPVKVKWIGRQTQTKLFTTPERFRPVKLLAGSLGPDSPRSDLVLTKDHGVVIDGVVVHAGALVNGTTIVEVAMNELATRETYYHVETEGHEVILANGTPAETFVDNVTRRSFDNYQEFQDLYGDNVPEMVELDMPRATTPRQVPQRLRVVLQERAEALGFVVKKSA